MAIPAADALRLPGARAGEPPGAGVVLHEMRRSPVRVGVAVTCIVGLATPDGVWMGADSFGSDGSQEIAYRSPKLIVAGELVLGFTESYRAGDLLRYSLRRLPERGRFDDPHEYMVTVVVELVRTVFKDGGYNKADGGRDTAATLLAACGGRLFLVGSDYCVLEPKSGFTAIGSGYLAAQGSLHTSDMLLWEPERRVRAALEAAAGLCAGVGPPFHVMQASPAAWWESPTPPAAVWDRCA